jgi:hypothetical protein
VLAPRVLVEQAVPGMRNRRWGRIVNVGSSSTREPIPELNLSNVHRAAAVAFFAADGPSYLTFEHLKAQQAALAKVKGAVKIIAPMTYRQRYHQSTGRDPLRCPHCHGEMTVWRIWHPTYGIIYDEATAIKRGRYERRRERAPTPGRARRPLPPPEEYLYRCAVCGEEALVKEEIFDVTIGRLKFDGQYRGGMPTLGCPGCEGDTLKYVEQDD